MRSSLAKCLLYVFLFSALTPAQLREELAKLPAFVAHFSAHQSINTDITFGAYWEMHYGQGFLRHATEHDHGSLPMKNSCTHSHAPGQPFFSTDFVLHILAPARPLGQQPVFTELAYHFTHLNDIWQPPKFC